jgi:hypothetical protein
MVLFFALGTSVLFGALVPPPVSKERRGDERRYLAGAFQDERLGALAGHLLSRDVPGARKILEEVRTSPRFQDLEGRSELYLRIAQQRLLSLEAGGRGGTEPLAVEGREIQDGRYLALQLEMLLESRREDEAHQLLEGASKFIPGMPRDQIVPVGRVLGPVVSGTGRLSLEEVCRLDPAVAGEAVLTLFDAARPDPSWKLLERYAVTAWSEPVEFGRVLDHFVREEKKRDGGRGLCLRLNSLAVSRDVAPVVESQLRTHCALEQTKGQAVSEKLLQAQKAEEQATTGDDGQRLTELRHAHALYRSAQEKAEFQSDKDHIAKSLDALETRIVELEKSLDEKEPGKTGEGDLNNPAPSR